MELAELVRIADQVGATRSRNEKRALLAELLGRLAPDEVSIAVGLLVGAPRQGKLGIGWAQVAAAREASGAGGSLSLASVDQRLAAIAALHGPGSQGQRRTALAELFTAVGADERDFLARLLVGELRQGALEGVVIDAIAVAARISVASVRAALTADAALGEVAGRALAAPGVPFATAVEPFRPLGPMLAQPAEDAAAAIDGIASASLEHKLDGARIQLHKRGDEVRLYSRGLRDVSAAVPELVAAGQRFAADTLILDGEAIAMRPDGRPQPFQVTMQRFGRKLEVDARALELPIQAFYFDCLYRDGEALLDRPLAERQAALDAAVPAEQRVTRIAIADAGAAADGFAAALAAGHEGAMIKDLTSPYLAGQRGGAWRKLKQAHTLDLVVLAVEWGSGRRQGTLSNLHLGARDPAGGFVMLGKTFKGMTDALLAWQTRELLAREVSREGHIVHVRPELVVEIAFNDVQVSRQYPGGVALRFARVKRYRADKTAAEADTIDAVRALLIE